MESNSKSIADLLQRLVSSKVEEPLFVWRFPKNLRRIISESNEHVLRQGTKKKQSNFRLAL